LVQDPSWWILERGSTEPSSLETGTKNEDNDIFPQGKNPGNRVFFESILETKEIRNT